MPREQSHGPHSVNSGLSALPIRPGSEPRRDQPLGEAPLLAEGTTPPPYPPAIDLSNINITEEHVSLATQDLLSYVGGMRQRAEQRATRSRTNAAEWEHQSNSTRPNIRSEELGPTGRVLPSGSVQKIR